MLELADIVRAAGPAYAHAHAGQLLPSQRRALDDIVACRTPALGGSLYRCDDCGALDYRYHSCRNRHCAKCQDDRAQRWLERVQHRLLPCDHYLLTFTLPQQLRTVARAHQRVVHAALLTVGILAVLHTWSRTLEYHPHVHLLVTAGGLAADESAWLRPAHPRFLFPGYALSPIFRATMRRALTRTGLEPEVDAASVRASTASSVSRFDNPLIEGIVQPCCAPSSAHGRSTHVHNDPGPSRAWPRGRALRMFAISSGVAEIDWASLKIQETTSSAPDRRIKFNRRFLPRLRTARISTALGRHQAFSKRPSRSRASCRHQLGRRCR